MGMPYMDIIDELEAWIALGDPKISPTYKLDEEEHNRFILFRQKQGHKFRTFNDLVRAYIQFLRN